MIYPFFPVIERSYNFPQCCCYEAHLGDRYCMAHAQLHLVYNPPSEIPVNTTQKFWLTFVPGSATPPSNRHKTKAAAVAEAQRLAIKVERTVYVLEAISSHTVSAPPLTDIELTEPAAEPVVGAGGAP